MIEQLGLGGFGEVWRAQKKDTGEYIALKSCSVINARNEVNHNLRDRFIQEAQIMMKLQHPNIALCRGWFEADGKIWIEQELCSGEL